MHPTRRSFIQSAAMLAAASTVAGSVDRASLDKTLAKPVLDTSFVKDPVIVASIELLRNDKTFMLRSRSKAGVEAVTFPNSLRMIDVYPLLLNDIVPAVLKQDARNLESLIWDVYRLHDNYKYQGMALWIGVMAIEQALLELLGKTANRTVADFFGGTLKRDIAVYRASHTRGNTPQAEIEKLQQLVAESGAKALKFRVGGRMNRNVDSLPGRTEALIPLVRKTFGDDIVIYADSNSSYDVAEGIRIGKMMQDHGYAFYEEPVEFDDLAGCKQVADVLDIPIALGEQEFSEHRFRWCIENRAADIMQPDLHYYGGMIRSTRVARMAAAAGMSVVPHMSGGSLGYLDVVHFASFTPNIGPYMEFKGNAEIPVSCATSSLKVENGVVRCPAGPGFGVTIDPAFVKTAKAVAAI